MKMRCYKPIVVLLLAALASQARELELLAYSAFQEMRVPSPCVVANPMNVALAGGTTRFGETGSFKGHSELARATNADRISHLHQSLPLWNHGDRPVARHATEPGESQQQSFLTATLTDLHEGRIAPGPYARLYILHARSGALPFRPRPHPGDKRRAGAKKVSILKIRKDLLRTAHHCECLVVLIDHILNARKHGDVVAEMPLPLQVHACVSVGLVEQVELITDRRPNALRRRRPGRCACSGEKSMRGWPEAVGSRR